MRDGHIFQRHADHVLPGDVAAFANGVRHFAGLAQTEPDAAVLIPGDDQRAEAETASAFHDLGGTIDVNHLFAQLVLALAISRPASRFRRASAPARTATADRATFLRIGSDFVSHLFSWFN